MKRTTIFALVAILVLAVAGGAFAWGGRGDRRVAPRETSGQRPPMMQNEMGFKRGMQQGNPRMMREMRCRGMHRGGMMGVRARIEIPQEIRDKQVELMKLSIDMRAEMQKNPIDRPRIEEIYNKSVALRNELDGWRMKQRLDMIEKLQK